MRHQIATKPHIYGLLLKLLNDASFPYTCKVCAYARKPEKGEGPYYIDSTENYVYYLFNQTANNVELQGRKFPWISCTQIYH